MKDVAVLKTRLWFAQNALNAIDELVTGEVKVEFINKVIAYELECYDEVLGGAYDHTFTFKQRMYYIETGESIALLG